MRGVREGGEAGGRRRLWSEEDIVSRSGSLASLQEEVLSALTLPGCRWMQRGGAASHLWGDALTPQQLLPLMEELLTLHLLQLLNRLHLRLLLTLLTQLL